MKISQNCPGHPDCDRLEEIWTLSPMTYDIDGLIGDICWLCDRKEQQKMVEPHISSPFVGEGSLDQVMWTTWSRIIL